MKSVLSPSPVFSPSSKTLSFSAIPGFVSNRLMVVLNQTTNNVLYAEGIAGLGGTWDAGKKVLTLQLDTTAGYSANDQLQAVYDAPAMPVIPQEELIDPVGKARVSTPQSLIDTDFEYGLQSTKWEFVQLVNNRPTFFYDVTQPMALIALSGSGTRQVSAFMFSPAALWAGNNVTGNTYVNVNSAAQASLPQIGQCIYVQDTFDSNANGFYYVDASYAASPAINPILPAGSSGLFTYTAKAPVASGSILDFTRTAIFSAFPYTGAAIPLSGLAHTLDNRSTSVTAFTVSAHNLHTGDQIYVMNTAMSGGTVGPTVGTTGPQALFVSPSASSPNGAWTISSTPNKRTLIFNTNFPVSGTRIGYLNPSALNPSQGFFSPVLSAGYLYPRPAGFSVHRPFDGGVQFTCGPYTPHARKVRQTRRYFRYQSGKGIQFSTGTILKPNFNIDQITAAANTVTVNTKSVHGVTPGCQIVVAGSTVPEYNGTYTVASVPRDTSFTYTVPVAPAQSPATGFPITVSLNSWFGGNVRVGLFDDQNGVFFEYDGQNLFAVRRSSTTQLAGLAVVTNGSNLVTGIGTRFADQLSVNDYIVLRGSNYRVTNIADQTRISVSPEYRGVSVTPAGPATGSLAPAGVVVSKVIDTRVRQDNWNIDKLDGTGPSGYTLDLTKMQMLYIDYSWYGAGFVRWGIRATNGSIIYCHKQVNNNVNTETYMRSGNLPGRYEVNSYPPYTYLDPDFTLASADATAMVLNHSQFPDQGIIRIIGNGDAAPIEYASYTSKGTSPLSFSGLTRGIPGGAAATTFAPASSAPVVVELVSNVTAQPAVSATPAALVSHWGSSVIMDGRFDEDLSYSFNVGNTGGTVFQQTAAVGGIVPAALMSLRLAPSVDSSRTGILGARELVNRMQLKLKALDISNNIPTNAASGAVWRIFVNLNGTINFPDRAWQPVGGSSLAQVCYYPSVAVANNVRVIGGENVFGFFYYGPGALQQDLSQVRDIGNSMLGGGTGLYVPSSYYGAEVFPDGPEVIHILAQLVAAPTSATTATLFSRLSWTESQA